MISDIMLILICESVKMRKQSRILGSHSGNRSTLFYVLDEREWRKVILDLAVSVISSWFFD